jgi:TRAP-type mannitol/chloroaromatic compound transport system permease small subunit
MSDLRRTTESELGAGVMPAPYLLPDTNMSRRIDRAVAAIGKAFSWLWVALIVVITLNVVLRYVFRSGFVALEEMQWHIYSVGFLLGLSYCITMDGHVRIDVMAEHLRPRTRAWIELIGILVLLLPFAIIILIEAVPFVLRSYNLGEVSGSPGGLPGRWVLKSFLVIGFGLVALAALSRLLRVTAFLFGRPRPMSPS